MEEGSNDILTMALGTPKHGGRVRGTVHMSLPINFFMSHHQEDLITNKKVWKMLVIKTLKRNGVNLKKGHVNRRKS